MGNQCDKHFSNLDHSNKQFPMWMKSLPDSALLTTLTIPGTHNSCSFFGTPIAITQTWSIPLQLKAGIRYFDIRLRPYYNTLRLQHGIMDQKCTFDVILKHFKEFLIEQPSEVIIMAVQHEYKPTNCTKTMEQLFDEYTEEYKGIINPYVGKDIEIGSIRGKILFINVFHSRIHKVIRVITQNDWVVNFPSNIREKKQKIKTLFNRAVTDAKDGMMYINYLSGVSDYGIVTPAHCANKTNRLVFKYKGRLGVVLCDFPGEELIEHLIEQNFFSSPAPIMRNKSDNVIHNSYVGFINVNTRKYLGLNDANEFCCIKDRFYFSIVLKNQSLTGNNHSDNGNGNANHSECNLICNGAKVKLMNIKNIFEYETIITKVKEDKMEKDKAKAIQELKQGDIVRLFDSRDIYNKQYLYSDYSLKLTKEQKVKLTLNRDNSGCEWVIDIFNTEESKLSLQE